MVLRGPLLLLLGIGALLGRAAEPEFDPPMQPVNAPVISVAELKAGMIGEVWTVFSGTEPEPFTVKVTGVIENSLGPGKSMILCELIDERVQKMGAVAGMSGSPLYINGRFAGALSYQVQRFETVRFAGFTPANDLLEVLQIALESSSSPPAGDQVYPVQTPRVSAEERKADAATLAGPAPTFSPLSPVFTFGGLSPQVATLFAGPFADLGLNTNSLGGSHQNEDDAPGDPVELKPGYAVGAALAIGDITLAGTGTVSQMNGNQVLAFGHPMLGLGAVEVPMTSAEIVAILPSNLSSFKIANSGRVIGTIRQDRLSAIYGEIGPPPDLVPVTVHTPQRTLRFSTVRHPSLTPMITAAGLSQAVLGSNDAGLTQGFRVRTHVDFPDGGSLSVDELYAGAGGFKAGLAALVQKLSTWLQNPVEEVFPTQVEFTVEPLLVNPTMSLDNVQMSRQIIEPGTDLVVTILLRDFQGKAQLEKIIVPMSPDWVGEKLEVIVADGNVLDALTGTQTTYPVSQIRNFSAYLEAIRQQRRTDGLFVAIVRISDIFQDQTATTFELPESFARVAKQSDQARFSQKIAREVLWQIHLQPDRLVPGLVRKPLKLSP